MTDDGWFNFDRLSLYQISYYSNQSYTISNMTMQMTMSLSQLFMRDMVKVLLTIQSHPIGEFYSNPIYNGTATIDAKNGNITLYGSIDEVNQTLS